MSDKKQVLVICQSAASQMYLGVVLNRIWYAPVLAKTAMEGVDIARKNPFSLIAFDADLPEQELRSSLALLRSDEAVKKLPLAVFRASGGSISQEALIAQGCSAVLTKPLDLALVYGVLSRLSGQPRTFPRAAAKFRVEIEEGTPEPVLTCVNISEGGLYLRTHAPLKEHTVLHLKFTLPLGAEVIETAGEVVRTAQLEARMHAEPGMGIQFIDLPEATRGQIRNYVQWELIGDLDWEPKADDFRLLRKE